MKKIITMTFLTFSILSFSQSKIEGIGKFKLKKMTTSSLNSLIKDEGFTKKTISSRDEYFKILREKKIVVEVFPDTIKSYKSPPKYFNKLSFLKERDPEKYLYAMSLSKKKFSIEEITLCFNDIDSSFKHFGLMSLG